MDSERRRGGWSRSFSVFLRKLPACNARPTFLREMVFAGIVSLARRMKENAAKQPLKSCWTAEISPGFNEHVQANPCEMEFFPRSEAWPVTVYVVA